MKLFHGTIYPEIEIFEEEQMHILKVLRMRSGEEIFLTDGSGNLIKGRLNIEGKRANIEAEKVSKIQIQQPYLHIAISPTKNIDRIEFFAEKATEMGISEITLIQTEKTERKNINIEKLRRQVVAASKQCLRTHFPIVNDLVKVDKFISTLNPYSTLVAHCDGSLPRKSLHEISEYQKLTFLIGPEGDFSSSEIKMMADSKINAVSLGPRRLRTETAGVFLVAWNYTKMLNNSF